MASPHLSTKSAAALFVCRAVQVMLTLGMLCAGLADWLLTASAGPSAWRWMVGLPAAPGEPTQGGGWLAGAYGPGLAYQQLLKYFERQSKQCVGFAPPVLDFCQLFLALLLCSFSVSCCTCAWCVPPQLPLAPPPHPSFSPSPPPPCLLLLFLQAVCCLCHCCCCLSLPAGWC